ncbi:MAG TPA: hypothetical protein VGQ62_13360, partial [Chloroflexota bacterium]|nr:hypothetical protein [Chloroflexota bacterium]
LVIADFWGTSHLHLSDVERSEINALAALAPLVLVSARAWLLDAENNDLDLVALMPKPLDMENFVAILRQALEPASPSASDVTDVTEGEQSTNLPARETLSVFVLGWP